MSKHWDTDSAGDYVTVIEEFTVDSYGHDQVKEIFRGTKADLEESILPHRVRTKGLSLTGGCMSDSTHRYHKEAYSDHLRRLELDGLLLALSKMKLNKAAESLSYNVSTINRAAFKMESIIHKAIISGPLTISLKRPYVEVITIDLNKLMEHANGSQGRAAVLTAYHNMKVSENRLN